MDPSDTEAASLVGLFVDVSLVVDDIDAMDASLLEKVCRSLDHRRNNPVVAHWPS